MIVFAIAITNQVVRIHSSHIGLREESTVVFLGDSSRRVKE